MDALYRYRPKEKYRDILIPLATALAAAHIFLCHDLLANPFRIILRSGYLPELGVNFLFALLIFLLINFLSQILDTFYPWRAARLTRLWLQFLFGVVGIMTLSVIAASLYFGVDGSDIANKAFFDSIFYSVLGYVVSINLYYNASAVHFWKFLGKKIHPGLFIPEPPEVPVIAGEDCPVLNLLMKHDIMLFHTAKDTTYATEANGNELFWPFRIISTLPVLDKTQYIQASRFYVVRRDAIAEVRRDGFKERMLVTLKFPLSGQIAVTTKFTDDFNRWYNQKD